MFHELTAAPELTELPRRRDSATSDEQPALMMLSRHGSGAGDSAGQVVAWVMALPNGDAVLLSLEQAGTAPFLTTMDNVRRRWTALLDAELAPVTPRHSRHDLAA